MSFQDQIFAAQQLEALHTEWLINPLYPENLDEEFDKVMRLLSYFIRRD